MQRNKDNIVLFPSLQKELEKESLKALEQENYSEALSSINNLLRYQVYTHELIMGKLFCLMELGYFDEAEAFCEDLLQENNDHYYDYLHLYLTILFQAQKYDALMNYIDFEINDRTLSNELTEKLQQLYHMSKHMKNDLFIEKSSQYMEELSESIKEQNDVRQWQIIENLRNMGISPPKKVMNYLSNINIHPVIKTAILKWLIDQKISNEVTICKFESESVIIPKDLPKIRDHFIMKEIILFIDEIEQNNPSLFILLEQLLYRFIYVRYPFIPPQEDIPYIARALKNIGDQFLHLKATEHTQDKVLDYIQEIKTCEKYYLGIIEE